MPRKPQDIRRLAKRRLIRLELSENAAAKRAGIPTSTVNRYLSGQRDLTSERLSRLLNVLGLVIVER